MERSDCFGLVMISSIVSVSVAGVHVYPFQPRVSMSIVGKTKLRYSGNRKSPGTQHRGFLDTNANRARTPAAAVCSTKSPACRHSEPRRPQWARAVVPVSYTHLTLPTIYSV